MPCTRNLRLSWNATKNDNNNHNHKHNGDRDDNADADESVNSDSFFHLKQIKTAQHTHLHVQFCKSVIIEIEHVPQQQQQQRGKLLCSMRMATTHIFTQFYRQFFLFLFSGFFVLLCRYFTCGVWACSMVLCLVVCRCACVRTHRQ